MSNVTEHNNDTPHSVRLVLAVGLLDSGTTAQRVIEPGSIRWFTNVHANPRCTGTTSAAIAGARERRHARQIRKSAPHARAPEK